MRADEKIDPDLELAAEQEVVEELEAKEQPAQEQIAEVSPSTVRFHELAAYIEARLGGTTAEVELGWMTDVEQRALELLTEAIDGRAVGSSRQIFAEDRMVMLEQALAALQPVLAVGFESAEVDAQIYDDLVVDLGELRATLSSLADAQEEVQAQDTMRMMGRDGKPVPPKKPPDAGEVGDDRPSTLATGGPAAPDKQPQPSTLAAGGPAAPDKQPQPSTLATGGPAAPDKQPQPSTAYDGDERGR